MDNDIGDTGEETPAHSPQAGVSYEDITDLISEVTISLIPSKESFLQEEHQETAERELRMEWSKQLEIPMFANEYGHIVISDELTYCGCLKETIQKDNDEMAIMQQHCGYTKKSHSGVTLKPKPFWQEINAYVDFDRKLLYCGPGASIFTSQKKQSRPSHIWLQCTLNYIVTTF